MISSREAALIVLHDIEQNRAFANLSLKTKLNELKVDEKDKNFVTEMTYGVLRWKLTLDYIISKYSKIKLKKISLWILNILRLGIYQISFLDKVPVSAACNESVMLAKKYGHKASVGFVNAILRNISRNIKSKDDLFSLIDNEKSKNYLSIKYSHPQWIIDLFNSQFEYDFMLSLLNANNQNPLTTVRINEIKTSKNNICEAFFKGGIRVREGKYIDEALVIENNNYELELDLYNKGMIQFQDEGSMIVSRILAPRSGEKVLDLCAAPGGKTTHIAQIMKNEGVVVACDVYQHRAKLVELNAKRLGTTIVETKIKDATVFEESFASRFDKVLVDAPCSGLGIIRRKPEIKWNKNEEKIADIVDTQKKILENAAHYVRCGGVLVYSTCTVANRENIDIIKWFLSIYREFELESIKDFVGSKMNNIEGLEKGYISLYPNIHKTDGFFVARLKKRGI